ncbi:Putative DNA mismatch repair protein [Sphingomonas sp. T1]|uniref:ATP-binding protein n=1 Tax=Sphingomonas sp. T1 TaxID=2653172 RepID=UPI0012EF58F1|nr:ATP-binding protein [Sphingomonas sp. T1]VXC69384.1 Putative DNA mismatch repair protein [Sphingomonas sp. T1]
MAEKSYPVEVKADFIARQSRCSLETALAELIWNSLDADATNVIVAVEEDGLGGYTSLVVSDNGHGISHAEAPALFRNLGGSWKNASGRTRSERRELHGKEGRGRFRALSIGSDISWDVTIEDAGVLTNYQIYLSEHDPAQVRITDPVIVVDRKPGVVVTVREIKRNLGLLYEPATAETLSHIFAVYLTAYQHVNLLIAGKKVDPRHAIIEDDRYELPPIEIDGFSYPCSLKIIEWSTKTKRMLFLATDKGFPVFQIEGKIQAEGVNFTSYLLSEYFPGIVDSGDVISPADRPEVKAAIDSARQQIRAHFRQKGVIQGLNLIEAWKAEHVYPFEGDPADSIDRAERNIFESVAVAVSAAVPDFEDAPKAQKALHLRLLKHAIEKSPHDLQKILSEVLKLPRAKQSELANLLSHSQLSDIISTSSVVGDRVQFLTGLRVILMNEDMKKVFGERAHLHKIVEKNTWIFGERYNLWASDKELTNVLRACSKELGDKVVIDEPVGVIDKERGIVDLVLGRTNKAGSADEYDNLIIELKAPKVRLKSDHVVQIEKYATAVSEDNRFHRVTGVRWHFWLIADDYDGYVKKRIEGGPDPRNRIIQDDGKVRIGIKTWGEVLDDNFARLHFVQDRLKYEASEQESLEKIAVDHQAALEKVKLTTEYIAFMKGSGTKIADTSVLPDTTRLLPGPNDDEAG